jgi:hypothetical protein
VVHLPNAPSFPVPVFWLVVKPKNMFIT